MSVIIEGKHIKGSPYDILVCRNYDELDNFFTGIVDDNGRMGNPWGIAFNKDGMWAVADHSGHCVCIFDGQNQLVRKFGSKGKDKGQFNSPTALTFDDDNYLYVVDRDNHRVQKFNTEGKCLLGFGRGDPLLRLFEGYQAGCDELGRPVGIAIHNGRVLVADQSKRRITVFKCNGNFRYNIVHSKMSEPCDVAVNINNQVLVADCGHHCIVIFTLGGQYVNTIGTEFLGKGKLEFPLSITTDLGGFIFVTLKIKDCAHIYDQYGSFVNFIGYKNAPDGGLSCPSGVALSPNGNTIYVSDRNNKRIQIFSYSH